MYNCLTLKSQTNFLNRQNCTSAASILAFAQGRVREKLASGINCNSNVVPRLF